MDKIENKEKTWWELEVEAIKAKREERPKVYRKIIEAYESGNGIDLSVRDYNFFISNFYDGHYLTGVLVGLALYREKHIGEDSVYRKLIEPRRFSYKPSFMSGSLKSFEYLRLSYNDLSELMDNLGTVLRGLELYHKECVEIEEKIPLVKPVYEDDHGTMDGRIH